MTCWACSAPLYGRHLHGPHVTGSGRIDYDRVARACSVAHAEHIDLNPQLYGGVDVVAWTFSRPTATL